MSSEFIILRYFCVIFTLVLCAFSISAQNTSFTYQGRFTDSTVTQPTNGSYTMKFRLYDALSNGNQAGNEQTAVVTVTNGVFTTSLDFATGPFSNGQALWLEIQVGTSTLTPRQKIESVPYAIRTLSAGSADWLSSLCSPCVTNDQIVSFEASKITGTILNATNATNATNAVNATNATTAVTITGVITTANVSGDVELAPSTQQTTSSTNHLINLKLVSTDPVNHRLGTPGVNALLSLSASGTYPDNSTHDKERFRVDNDGSILSVADYTGGVNTTAPIEGSGTRFMWYASKSALRAGQINGTQWDDANIGLFSTAFGENVRALGDNSIVVGKNSVAANTGTVAFGEGHTATGANSIALGYGASTSTIAGSPRTGTFVFSDRSVPLTYTFNSTTPDIGSQFHPTVTNSFNVRAVNGSFFYTNTALTTGFIFNSTTATMTLTNSKLTMASDGSTTLTSNSGGSSGVTLPAGGGSWNNLSDRNMKENFAVVDSRQILRGVLGLPISTWNYKSQDPSIRHIGMMAQDFSSIFKVGENDTSISTIDPDGIAFAAIQGLYFELKDRDGKIEQQQQQLTQFQERLNQQQATIDGLKQLLCSGNRTAAVCK